LIGVDALDLLILTLAVGAALGGYRLGFLGRMVSWIGLAAGLYLAVRLLPTVINHFHSSTPGPLLSVAVLILVGGAMIGQGIGTVAGSRLHQTLPLGPLRSADRVVGAGIGALGILAVVWMILPPVAAVPGWPARAVANSAISRWMWRSLPNPPDPLQTLRRLIGNGAPEVFSALGPSVSAGPLPASSPLGGPVTAAVAASTVEVQGQACNEILEGSGFTVATDLVVTNAHVVAGEPGGSTSVLLPSGASRPATVIMFDPRIDIAVLSVRGLGEAPLPIGSAAVGSIGAVFGHPNGQIRLAVTPARVAREEDAIGADLYGHTATRQILVLAAALAHGDSGGALVDTSGRVVGVAFAISPDRPGTSYALSAGELNTALGEARQPGGVGTGSCLTS
jgi:S1-C subfamily serine protease